VLLGQSGALLYWDIVTHLVRGALASHYGHVDTLLVGGGMAVSLLHLHTLLLGHRVAHLAGYLAGGTVAVSLGHRHAELLCGGVTLGVGDWMTLFVGFRVAILAIGWLAVSAWLCMWDIDTLLAWNRPTFLLRDRLATFSGLGGALHPSSSRGAMLLIDSGANLG